jgi:hypothetical protein
VIPVTFGDGKPWLPESQKREDGHEEASHSWSLGLFLAEHGVVGFMSIYPEAALDGSGSWNGGWSV